MKHKARPFEPKSIPSGGEPHRNEKGESFGRQFCLFLALRGLEAERARIDSEIAEIRSQLSGATAPTLAVVAVTGKRRRRKMNAEARRRISEAMKRKHAERRATAQTGQNTTQRQRTGITPAGRKKLSEMMKARWAAKRKAAAKK